MTTLRDGEFGTWNQTVGVKVDMDEAIQILDPTDHPLTSRIPDGPLAMSTKVEWLEEDLTPQEATYDTKTGSASPWTLTFSTDPTQVFVFNPGDIIWQVDGALALQWRVESTDNVAGTMVVSGFAGNTTAPATTSALRIIGQFRDEGGAPEELRSVERNSNYNLTQIFEEAIEATRTSRTRGQRGGLYGQGDPYDHELQKKFAELGIRIERNNLLGQRSVSSDLKRRSAGGFFYFTGVTNVASGTVSSLTSDVDTLLQHINEKGGQASILMCSFAVKKAISSAYNASIRRTDRSDTVGGSVVDTILTNFGEVMVVANRHMPKTRYIVPDMRFIKRRVLDGLFHEMLAKTQDGDLGHIVGEWSLEVKNEKAHGVGTVTDAA